MERIAAHIVAVAMSLLLVSCGNSGSSADPPVGGLTVIAGDGRATVSWSMASGVDYWLWFSTSSSLTSSDPGAVPGTALRMTVSSPYVVSGLANGTTYYFTMNGRIDGGPGGTGTPLVSATPRLAGSAPSVWTVGTPLGATDLRGIAFGAAFLAVGATGAMFSSPDGITWTPLSFVVGTDLNAALFNSSTYLAAGTGGVILTSPDAQTWQTRNSGTANALYGVAGNGAGVFVAVGASGTIVASTGGTNWSVVNSGSVQDLRAVTFANGMFVAVGAAGVVLTSTDATNWIAAVSNTALDLNGVAFGASNFVAIGAAGTLVTSPDGATWTAQPPITANALAAVTFATQFVTVGSNGTILTSTDGKSWAAQPSGTVNALKAVANGNAGYASVGATGTNLTAY